METTGRPLESWVGRQEVARDVITPGPFAALAATLDRDPSRPPDGTPLPPLWHWLYFLPAHRRSELGPDGHARRGGFLPPVALPRRMWAGGRFAFHRPIRIGDAVTRLSTIERVAAKSGRTGALVFVTVRHEFTREGDAEASLVERHDIVYREAPRPDEPSVPPRPAPRTSAWRADWAPDDVLLFRYSALTFNGHRIHFDRRYATEVEGYPGLVVHGPLVATLLVDLVLRERPDATLESFEFRAVRPLFDIAPFAVCGQPEGDGRSVRLWARSAEGFLAMEATARTL